MTAAIATEVESDSTGWKDLGILVDDFVASLDEALGTLDEAKTIWDTIGDNPYGARDDLAPEGWKYLGSGKSRSAWLAPSGVVYKVCHRYWGRSLSSNDIEHKNFNYIRKSGKLKPGWRVPKSHLHIFEGTNSRTDGRVAVLACEYAEGDTWSQSYESEMESAMNEVGLNDCYAGNAVMGSDGTKWIVDAAENLLELEDNSNE